MKTDRRTILPAPWRATDRRRTYVHPTGWRIEHCGHPTALWPYALYTPKGDLLVGRNGMAFRTSALAALEAARVMAGGTARRAHEPAPEHGYDGAIA